MPYDNNRRAQVNRTIANPIAAPRSKPGGYIAPRLAGSPITHSSPELGRVLRTVANAKQKEAPKEDASTPVKAFLNSNVTPRSGSRKARVDSVSSTPSGTPNRTPSSSRPTSIHAGREPGVRESSTPNRPNGASVESKLHDHSNSTISNTAPTSGSFRGPSPKRQFHSPQNSQASPKFFRADEAKSRPAPRPATRPVQTSTQGRQQGFVYANEKQESPRPKSLKVDSREQSAAKFLRGNGTPEVDSTSIKSRTSTSSSPVTRNSPKSSFSQTSRVVQALPTSPLKGSAVDDDTSSPKSSQRLSNGTRKSSIGSQGSPLSSITSPLGLRPTSLKSYSTPIRHMKSQCLDSPIQKSASMFSQPTAASASPSSIFSPSPVVASPEPFAPLPAASAAPKTSAPTVSGQHSASSPFAPFLQTPNSPLTTPVLTTTAAVQTTVPAGIAASDTFSTTTAATNSTTTTVSPSMKAPPSPPKPFASDLAILAANARRERKVLDLEISNSSLLAINRTLERSLRKQNAELRRYRRLADSGRISLVSAGRRSRGSGNMGLADSMGDEEDEDDGDDGENDFGFPSDLSDTDSSEADDPRATLSSLSAFDTLDPPTPSTGSSPISALDRASFGRRSSRPRDSQRLALAHLRLHRALLADSQALNQSLKRCLGRTEALIDEGRRALKYRVRVSEIALGGRVLCAGEEEVEEGGESGQERRMALCSPGADVGAREVGWLAEKEVEASGTLGSQVESNGALECADGGQVRLADKDALAQSPAAEDRVATAGLDALDAFPPP